MPTFLEQVDSGSVQAPASAGMLIAAANLAGEFAKDSSGRKKKPTRDENGHYTFPVSLLARSPDPINHWYWGKIVHNLAGMKTNGKKVALDWQHYSDAICGDGECEVTADGLMLKGEVVSFREGDYGDQICNYLVAGIPLEASIQFDMEQGFKLSYLKKDESAKVNGREIVGSCAVADEWLLRRVAICPSGYDPNTRTQALSAERNNTALVAISVSRQETSPPPSPSSLSTEDTMPTEQTPAQAAAATPAPTLPAAGQLSIVELKRFTDRFGFENGSKWALEGLSYEAALDRHALALETARTEAAAALAQKDQTIAAMSLGHKDPATHTASDAPAKPATPAVALDGVGTFAASLEGEFATLMGRAAK